MSFPDLKVNSLVSNKLKHSINPIHYYPVRFSDDYTNGAEPAAHAFWLFYARECENGPSRL